MAEEGVEKAVQSIGKAIQGLHSALIKFDDSIRKVDSGITRIAESPPPLPAPPTSPETTEPGEVKHEITLPPVRKEMTRGVRKLLEVMREMQAAEQHLVQKYPELALAIRLIRKKVEAEIL